MAELEPRSFLSSAFSKIFDRLSSRTFLNFFRGKKSISDQLRALKRKLETASLLLDDAEDRQISDLGVKKWLDDLKDIIFRADDLIEKINDEARSRQELEYGSTVARIINFMSPFEFTEFEKAVQAEVEMVLEDLDSLLDKRVVLGLKADTLYTGSSPRLPAPLRDERRVYGRDADKVKILELLLSDDVWGYKIGVLPIVGMGGLGKTTIAQLVYDDYELNCSFDHKAWVTVSTEFDIFRIGKTILQQVSSQDPSGIEEPSELQRLLKGALRGKKYLCVLDDVWDEDYNNWDFLMSTFAYGERGSRIIVTTRSHKVASIVKTGPAYELWQVSNESCWQIFVDHAFNGSDSEADPALIEIGKRIVEKCKGIPLAVTSIAGLLRWERNPRRWEYILRSHVWEWCKSQSNDLLPSLWLSYRHLPSCLKQCFAYCSVFPKDYEFEKNKLILLWMAQGFLQFDREEKRLEEVGEEYFNILMSSSLFQRSSRSKSKFLMHDLVHDLAMFVSSEFCVVLDDEKNLNHLTSKTRHFSHNVSVDQDLWTSLSDAIHLRTFITLGQYVSSYHLVEKLITEERCLRVLSLSMESSISTLPDSFNNLKHLRYLDLSGSEIAEVPRSICTLYNLQTLLLSNCQRLARLPTHMERLINLRHLVTTGTPLKEMPPNMGKLRELWTLSDYVLGELDGGSSISELKELQHLGGTLRISGLQSIQSVEDVRKANLKEKVNLEELALVWEGETTDTGREKEILDALQPNANLTRLAIYSYAASNFPNWVGDSSFSKMVSLHLTGNRGSCSSLPALGQLPSLRELVIGSFHGMEKIGAEFYIGHNSFDPPFQSLETLKFYDMRGWKEWSFVVQEYRECFPRLIELRLIDCVNLTDCNGIGIASIFDSCKYKGSLPLEKFPNLKHLELMRCENLKTLTVDSPDGIEALQIQNCYKLEFPGSHRYEHARRLTIGCISLESFPLDYFPKLEELRLYDCQNLESLVFTEKTGAAFYSLISLLVLDDCKNFKSLPEHMHKLLPCLSVMRIRNCPEIESFPEGGLPSNLHELSLENCCKIITQHRHWDLQGLTSLRSIEISFYQDKMLDPFPAGLLPSSLTSFSLSKFPHLKRLNGSAFQNVASLDRLLLSYCDELQFLPEEILLPSFLRSLSINDCPLLALRYRPGEGEDWYRISHVPEISIYGKIPEEAHWEMESDGEEDGQCQSASKFGNHYVLCSTDAFDR